MPELKVKYEAADEKMKESKVLLLDSTKAQKVLQWKPVWKTSEALDKTFSWYKNFIQKSTIDTEKNFREYLDDAVKAQSVWIGS